MKTNEGSVDRILRIIVGFALMAWAFWGTGEYHQWGWLGAIPLITGLIGWCPAYSIFGINTCKTKHTR